MKLRKIGNTYHAVVKKPNGDSTTITTRQTDIRAARQMVKKSGLIELEKASQVGRLTSEVIGRLTSGGKMTVSKAVGKWEKWMAAVGKAPKTIHNSVTTVNAWMHDSGVENFAPAAITEEQINHWINSEESNAKAQTRMVSLAAIRSFFAFCTAKGWSVGDPSRLVKVRMDLLSHSQKEVAEKIPFTKGEVSRLTKYLRDKGNVFWEFAVRISDEIALRLGDICQLEWECFTKPGRVVVWTDKRDRRVSVPISDALAELVTEIPVRDPKYLFPEQRAVTIDPSKKAALSVQFKRIAVRCGIEGKSFHSLRHTCITRWSDEGKSLESIGKEVGHVSTKTTKGYVH